MDLTVLAIPGFFGSMGYEAWWLRRRAETDGPSPVDYQRDDTIASLAMGTGSLVIPLVTSRLSRHFALGKGRWAKPLLGASAVAAIAATVADAVARRNDQQAGEVTTGVESPAKRFAGGAAVAAIAGAGVAAASTWAARTSAKKLFDKRVLPDLGGGVVGVTAAIIGWDFIYYWNHRLQHESRIMWAIHVVHHSSERYNLSTALRQPWAESLGLFIPYGLLSLLGVRPNHIETARGLNLIYQYWIHTDAIRSIGPLESVLNTPSHHRAHHGSNRQYLDRNHGSILIVWDKLFGTFEPEDEPVIYGLTKNIHTFNPLKVATHEYADIVRDVAASDNWHDRLSNVLRGPGWAYERRTATI